LTSVIDTIGSFFSTSTSFMIGLFLPLPFAAFLRRKRVGRSQQNAVMVMRARIAATPPTAITARTAVERPPIDAVMVINRRGFKVDVWLVGDRVIVEYKACYTAVGRIGYDF
jgi:hypothetical protein